eukprot:126248-Chlamydomonas_euryale.AAC.10
MRMHCLHQQRPPIHTPHLHEQRVQRHCRRSNAERQQTLRCDASHTPDRHERAAQAKHVDSDAAVHVVGHLEHVRRVQALRSACGYVLCGHPSTRSGKVCSLTQHVRAGAFLVCQGKGIGIHFRFVQPWLLDPAFLLACIIATRLARDSDTLATAPLHPLALSPQPLPYTTPRLRTTSTPSPRTYVPHLFLAGQRLGLRCVLLALGLDDAADAAADAREAEVAVRRCKPGKNAGKRKKCDGRGGALRGTGQV